MSTLRSVFAFYFFFSIAVFCAILLIVAAALFVVLPFEIETDKVLCDLFLMLVLTRLRWCGSIVSSVTLYLSVLLFFCSLCLFISFVLSLCQSLNLSIPQSISYTKDYFGFISNVLMHLSFELCHIKCDYNCFK